MSTDVLRLISRDPSYQPDERVLRQAETLLRSLLPDSEQVAGELWGETRFVDPGENFESIHCPSCGVEVHEPWWADAMDVAFANGFTDLAIVLPCCSTLSSLHDLDYRWAAGFARFVLEAAEPNIGEPLGPEAVAALEDVLGTRLRQIRVRY